MALDSVELFRPVTKHARRVEDTGQIASAITEAFAVARHGRPGPVLVELPEDVLTGLAPRSGQPRGICDAPNGPAPDRGTLEQAATAMIAARRPLLIVGSGVRWASPFAELRELVDGMAMPFITSSVARGAVPDGHPLCMNAAPWEAQSQADVVIVLGARLNWSLRYGEHIAAEATVIQVDVELDELARSGKVTIGVHADAARFLHALLRELGPARRAEARRRRDQSWFRALQETCMRSNARREAAAGSGASTVSPLGLAAAIRNALPHDAISIFDGNVTMAASQMIIPSQVPVSRLTPGNSGCMGVGIPFAIAAKLAHPARPVVAICGDFAFGLSVMELETAARHRIPIVIVVANNDGNGGALRHRMHMHGIDSEPVMRFQPGLRYDAIAAALGCHAEHVEHAKDIGPALSRAIASKRPACINVAVDPDAPFPRD
jgi:2-hydroxyacyl-CoA lyase 1